MLLVSHPDGKSTYYPDLRIFSNHKGNYLTVPNHPKHENKYGYYTEETESYEEALKIVQTQGNQ